MENCVFCKIVKGELPSFKIWEDQDFLAFLTIQPINPGHTLLIPKIHVPYIFDLDDQILSEFLVKAKPLAKAIKLAMNPQTGRVGLMVAGGEVAHTHLHLIPMNQDSDLNFDLQKASTPEELTQIANKIKEFLR